MVTTTIREQPIIWEGHLEPKQAARKKLIISVATGWLNRQQNPTIPYSPQEIASEVIEAYRAGARIWHIHVRQREGGSLRLSPEERIEIHKETCDLVFRECPDIITSPSGAQPEADDSVEARVGGYFAPLVKANPHYAETALLNIGIANIGIPNKRQVVHINRFPQMLEQVRALQALGVKPEVVCYSMAAIEEVKEYMLSELAKPWFFDVVVGLHSSPPGKLELLKVFLDLLPPREDVVWQALMGGRNWLPLTVLAIMYGADVVRIGKEDAIFVYPDQDRKVDSCAESVAKIVRIAKELGIEIASANEARERLGLKPKW